MKNEKLKAIRWADNNKHEAGFYTGPGLYAKSSEHIYGWGYIFYEKVSDINFKDEDVDIRYLINEYDLKLAYSIIDFYPAFSIFEIPKQDRLRTVEFLLGRDNFVILYYINRYFDTDGRLNYDRLELHKHRHFYTDESNHNELESHRYGKNISIHAESFTLGNEFELSFECTTEIFHKLIGDPESYHYILKNAKIDELMAVSREIFSHPIWGTLSYKFYKNNFIN